MAKHTCTICGATKEWSGEWLWYGSIADMDEAMPILKTCSVACKEKLDAAGADKMLAVLQIQVLGYRLARRGGKILKSR